MHFNKHHEREFNKALDRQVLNSKDFGVSQSRKRVYIVGYLRERCAGTVFSFNETNGERATHKAVKIGAKAKVPKTSVYRLRYTQAPTTQASSCIKHSV